jgi:hypothetical protein
MLGGKILIVAGIILAFKFIIRADIIIDNFDANQSLSMNLGKLTGRVSRLRRQTDTRNRKDNNM